MNTIPTTIAIAIRIFQGYAVGDTIEERFKNVIMPQHVSEACFMTTNEDEQFRAAVGAVMLSYGPGTPEFERIETEMRAIQQFSAFIQAASTGLNVSVPELEAREPIGLIKLWHGRTR